MNTLNGDCFIANIDKMFISWQIIVILELLIKIKFDSIKTHNSESQGQEEAGHT